MAILSDRQVVSTASAFFDKIKVTESAVVNTVMNESDKNGEIVLGEIRDSWDSRCRKKLE